MAKVNLKHLASAIDQQIDRVIDGSVVVENTLSEVDGTSDNPVSGKGIAEAIEAVKGRGYIYMGVATPTTKPDVSGGKVFYLAAQAGRYSNFEIMLPANALFSLEWNGERWLSTRILEFATPGNITSVEKQVTKNTEDIANKANTTEYYPEMAVGTADNLRGRGETTEEIFSYRPSAGATDNISEEGVATMKRIKGNSLVWNQKAIFRDSQTEKGLTCVKEGNTIHLYGTVTEAFTYDTYVLTAYLSQGLKRDGRKYLISINAPDGVAYGINGFPIINTKPYFWSDGAGGVFYGYISIKIPVGTTVDYVFSNPQIIDLTQMFGAGNEPTTVEEFYERIPMGIDPYAYNKGELLSVNAESIVTNGFNQFNGEYAEVLPNNTYYLGGEYTSIGFAEELGGTTEEIVLAEDRLYTPATKGYIYASGANININLSHSGVSDGEYEPYEERVHEIPEIAQYFPEGMRSVGGVFDEINEHEVVQRVGQRAYAEGDNDNPAVMTDGVNTVYPLDTPVVTPMPARAINLNYTVWDWGTERAVSDVPSAPFRADIIYGFNAVDTIRMNKRDIKALLQRITALEAKVAESEAEATAESTDI